MEFVTAWNEFVSAVTSLFLPAGDVGGEIIDIRILPSFTQISIFFTNGKKNLNFVQVLIKMPTPDIKNLGNISRKNIGSEFP